MPDPHRSQGHSLAPKGRCAAGFLLLASDFPACSRDGGRYGLCRKHGCLMRQMLCCLWEGDLVDKSRCPAATITLAGTSKTVPVRNRARADDTSASTLACRTGGMLAKSGWQGVLTSCRYTHSSCGDPAQILGRVSPSS